LQSENVLDVGIDTRITQNVPVRLHTDLKAAKGYVIVGAPVLIPSSVQISGARKILTRIFEIPTTAIRIPDLHGSDTLELTLNLEGYANQVSLVQRTIRVAIQVQKRIIRKFPNLPVQLVGPSQQTHPKIQPDHVSLEVTGGEDVLRELPAQEIRIFLETTRFAIEGTDSLIPTVFIDRPIESWTLIPSTIHLVETAP
jgi:YbbR domain-containing protein